MHRKGGLIPLISGEHTASVSGICCIDHRKGCRHAWCLLPGMQKARSRELALRRTLLLLTSTQDASRRATGCSTSGLVSSVRWSGAASCRRSLRPNHYNVTKWLHHMTACSRQISGPLASSLLPFSLHAWPKKLCWHCQFAERNRVQHIKLFICPDLIPEWRCP